MPANSASIPWLDHPASYQSEHPKNAPCAGIMLPVNSCHGFRPAVSLHSLRNRPYGLEPP